MCFRFYPLRFEFEARESLFFPPGKAGNILRGALGSIFRRIACVPHCQNASTCDIRESCPYARVFEPTQGGTDFSLCKSPSGLHDSPRPFVFRARHLDGHTIQPGESFYFDLHVFSLDRDVLAYFILTFAQLATEGIGPRRGKAELRRVRKMGTGFEFPPSQSSENTTPLSAEIRCLYPFFQQSPQVVPDQVVYDQSTQLIAGSIDPVSLDLTPPDSSPNRIRVEFLSPTELKHAHKIAPRPEFPILFGRIRDRISTLRDLYGEGPLDIDFQASNASAAKVRMTHCTVRRQESDRRSSRTGQTHSIGGFVGAAEYEGDLAEFIRYLEAARWIGVGRQAVWGKGEIAVSARISEALNAVALLQRMPD